MLLIVGGIDVPATLNSNGEAALKSNTTVPYIARLLSSNWGAKEEGVVPIVGAYLFAARRLMIYAYSILGLRTSRLRTRAT